MKNTEIEKLYQQYYNEVLLYALSLCNDYYLAETLTSDTFYKAIMNIDKTKSNIKFWLFRVCKNHYIDLLRSKKHFQFSNNFSNDNLATYLSVLDKIIKDEQNKLLYLAILKLKYPYKECIQLYYFHNYSMIEVAEIMQMKAGAIRTIIYRARIKLKELLKENYNEL